jgi:hypothetical protein
MSEFQNHMVVMGLYIGGHLATLMVWTPDRSIERNRSER